MLLPGIFFKDSNYSGFFFPQPTLQSSTSHLPSRLLPTATSVPSAFRPSVCAFPVLMATMSVHSSTSHSPFSLSPTASTVPSAFRPTVCQPLASIATMSVHSPTSHCPYVLSPAATTVPLEHSATVKFIPTATCVIFPQVSTLHWP